ncbi:MAG: adenylate/guanylate cyclase domain-containing protein [Alphaproteobacteria bacterium]
MVSIVHYEVYLYQHGRWQLHGRYSSNQKKQAIDDARYTEDALSCPSKVIRELYETSSGEVEEVVIYISPKIRSQQYSRGPQSMSSSGGTLWDSIRQSNQDRLLDNKKSPAVDASIKFVSVIGISILLAVFFAVVITFLVSYLSHKGSIAPTNPGKIFVTVFVAVFIFSSVPLASAFVPWQAFGQDDAPSKQKENPNRTSKLSSLLNKKEDGLNPLSSLIMWLFRLDNKVDVEKQNNSNNPSNSSINEPEINLDFGKIQEQEKKEENNFQGNPILASEAKSKAEEALKTAEATKTDGKELFKNDKEEKEVKSSPKPENKQQPKNPPQKDKTLKEEIKEAIKEVAQETAKTNKAEQQEKPPEPLDEELENCRTIMMKFLGGVISAYKTKYKQIDAYNKFGLNLVLAGAVDNLRQQDKISDTNYNKLVCETIEFLGTNQALALAFCKKLEEYSLEPAYLTMLHSGMDSMEKMQQKMADPFKVILDALENWNKPEQTSQDKKPSGIMTIMFTDMVNSTASTQNLGDEAAQELVRTHNRIVRSVLGDFEGKEVKHTGDGIMASFTSSSNALEAAVRIQKSFEKYNLEAPEVPIKIRIGINAGEPIVEEDDLFGTTVQVAARVCDFANPEQVLVTNVVKELSAGKIKQFYNLGPTPLKGIKEPTILYEVVWQDEDLIDAQQNDVDNLSEEISSISSDGNVETPAESKDSTDNDVKP